MDKKVSNLDPDTQRHIEEMAIAVAERQAAEAPPDPLHPKELIRRRVQAEVQQQITEFFENFVKGLKELVTTLNELSQEDPKYYSEDVIAQLDKLSEGLTLLGENPEDNRSPREVAGITQDTMIIFNKAAAHLYEKKEYDKSSAVYSFLAFIDPGEPAYWMGSGNSEYFQQHYDKALANYKTVGEIDPQDPHCHFYSAHCYHELNENDKAIESANSAIEVIKRNPSLKEWLEQAEGLKEFLKETQHKH